MDYGNLKVPENVTPEVQAILDSYQARNKEIENAHRKNTGRIWLGSALSGASAHPVFNIPYIGTGLGGALYELGQGITEGDKLPELAKRTGTGFAIGETVGAIPYAGKYANKLSGGKIGNAFTAGVEKIASTPLGQKVTEIAPKVEDLLMTDIKAYNPFKQTQTAYHGSPYDFAKFSNEAIGTGEGAQAHGMGHYSAKNKKIAENYREALTSEQPNEIYYKNKPIDEEMLKSALYKLKNYGFDDAEKYVKKSLDFYKTQYDKAVSKYPDATQYIENQKHFVDNAEKLLKDLPTINLNDINLKQPTAGQLYKLSIPKDDVMLREGATFAEQPVKVQEMYRQAQKNKLAERLNEIQETKDFLYRDLENAKNKGSDRLIYATEQMLNDELPTLNRWTDDITEQLKNIDNKDYFDNLGYRELLIDLLPENSRPALERLTDKEAKIVSERLNNAGIKGISYNGGIDGEANVIFNPDDIEIVRKYYNQPELWDKLKGLRPNEGAELAAIENALRNPQFPMNEQDFNAYEDLGLRYYQNIFQPNTIEIPGYGVASFSRKNRGKDDVTNFRMYPDLFELLTGAKPVNRTNYKNELDRQYDYLENPNNKIYQFLMEDIKDKGKRYKMMRNKETGK